jgi:tetratricopeptide (TPR) repeat protein
MSVDRKERLKQILSGALECESAARTAFLDQNCLGDDEMRRELEELIAASETADDFLETPLFRVPAGLPAEAMAGRRLGQYRLVRRIGRGGMGAVYLSEREDGEFTRQVAIKVVRSGFDSEEILGRFRRERQILASLAHPHIAMLLDGGATEDGAPYFVMEYIDGQPIDQWIRSRALSIQQRLALFRSICSAVEHAHRNLVVHGDIKPANILVTGDGVAKLLDFGIARLAGREDEPQAPIAWTPKFASPEQRRGEPINTVSDVFSLGVLLDDILLDRRADAGDLNAIIEKATRADPLERYPTVDALATDIMRHLEGKPVAAHPATPWYRMRKFVRRHRWPVAFAALLALAITTKVGSDRRQAGMVLAERDRAERRFQDVRQLAKALIFEIEEQVAKLPGSTTVRGTLVARALTYLDRLASEAAGDLQLLHELAEAYLKLGDVQGRPGASNLGRSEHAGESYRKAIRMCEALVAAEPGNPRWEEALASAYGRQSALLKLMGDYRGGLDLDRKALAIRAALLQQNPGSLEFKRAVAANYTSLGGSLSQIGDWDGVLDARKRALELYQQLFAHDPHNTSDRRGLALAYSRLGGILLHNSNLAEAVKDYREALKNESALAAENPDDNQIRMSLASAHVTLGAALLEFPDYPGALTNYQQALDIQQNMATLDPHDARTQSLLSTTLLRIGTVMLREGKPTEALPYLERCLRMRRHLAEANPTNAGAQGEMALALAAVGDLRLALGQRAEARRLYTESVELHSSLQRRSQANANLDNDMKKVHEALARLRVR